MSAILRVFADICYRINPCFYYGLRYFIVRKRWPDFNHPKDLSEYLLGKMLGIDFKQFAIYADKVKVRAYVEAKGFSELLPQLYGVWESAEAIDFDSLPHKFALKTNHGCGNHVLCRKKEELSLENTRCLMDKLISKPFTIREPHYLYIEPRIYAEELIECPQGSSLVDYKFMCVKGKIKCILICSDRSNDFHDITRVVVNKQWHLLPWISDATSSIKLPDPPIHLDRMVYIAEQLSADFDFVRVDLYDTGKKVYFGELTFTPNSSILTHWTTSALKEMAMDLL